MAFSALLTTVLVALPQLSAEELQTVQSRMRASVSLTQTDPTTSQSAPDYVLDGLCNELQKRGALAKGRRLPRSRNSQGVSGGFGHGPSVF
jgi:hypothetical protein